MARFVPTGQEVEPLEFDIDDRKYVIPKITQTLLEEIVSGSEDNIVDIFSKLTGAPREEFMNDDVRLLTAIIEWIMAEVTPKGADAKNG